MSMLRGWSESAGSITIEVICLDDEEVREPFVLCESEQKRFCSPREARNAPHVHDLKHTDGPTNRDSISANNIFPSAERAPLCLADKENEVTSPLSSSRLNAATRKTILERRGSLQLTPANMVLMETDYNSTLKPSNASERQIRSMSHVESSTRCTSFSFEHMHSKDALSKGGKPSDQTLSSRSSQSSQSTAPSTPSLDLSAPAVATNTDSTAAEQIHEPAAEVSNVKEDPYEWAYEVWRKKGLMVHQRMPRISPNGVESGIKPQQQEQQTTSPSPPSPPSPPLLVTPRHSVVELFPKAVEPSCLRRQSLPVGGPVSAKKQGGRKSFANILQQWRDKSDDKPNSHFLSPEQFTPLCAPARLKSKTASQSKEDHNVGPQQPELSSPEVAVAEPLAMVGMLVSSPRDPGVLEDAEGSLPTSISSKVAPATKEDRSLHSPLSNSEPLDDSIKLQGEESPHADETTTSERAASIPATETQQEASSLQSVYDDVKLVNERALLPSEHARLLEFKTRAEEKAERRRIQRQEKKVEEGSSKIRHAKSPPRSHADFRSAIQSQVDNVLRTVRNSESSFPDAELDKRSTAHRSKSAPRSVRRKADQILRVKRPTIDDGASPAARPTYRRSQSGGFIFEDVAFEDHREQRQRFPTPTNVSERGNGIGRPCDPLSDLADYHFSLRPEDVELPERLVVTRVKDLVTPTGAGMRSTIGDNNTDHRRDVMIETSSSGLSKAKRAIERQSPTTNNLLSGGCDVKDSPWTKRFVATLNERVKSENEHISPRDQPSLERPWRRDMIIRKAESFSTEKSLHLNAVYNENDDGECRCSNSAFSGRDEMIEFFLPQMGMACTCGKRRPGLMNPEEPTSLENVLRPWQVEFLAAFGIYRGDQLVKAHHRSASHLATALRQYRKKLGMKPFPTESCGMALQIWSKTSKAFVRSIRKQVTDGLGELKLPNTMYILSNFLDKLPSVEHTRMNSVTAVNGIELLSQKEL